MKKFLSLLILTAIVSSGFSDVPGPKDDAPGHHYYEILTYLQDKEIISGYSDGTFRPNTPINRVELLRIVMDAANYPSPEVSETETAGFPDVQAHAWYMRYIVEAKNNQIISGNSDGTFRPEANTNIVEALKIIFLANDIAIPEQKPAQDWYEPFVNTAYALAIFPNLEIDTFDPGQSITRGQFAELAFQISYMKEENLSQFSWPEWIPQPNQEPYISETPFENPVETPIETPIEEIVITGPTSPFFGSTVPCTENPNLIFSHSLVNFQDISAIIPPGSPNGDVIKSHSYIESAKGNEIPIYAPTDSMLIAGVHYSEDPARSEYMLTFQTSCEIIFLLDHFTSPVAKIISALPETPQVGTQTNGTIPPLLIEFKAGELLGYSSGTTQAKRFDFGLYDINQENQFANPERQRGWRDFNSACPYDYFESDVKIAYYARFATLGGSIVNTNNECRSADQDLKGTIQGAWYDSPSEAQKQLAIVQEIDNNELRIVRSNKQHITIRSYNSTFKFPREITTEHCYQDDDEYIYFKNISDTEMAINEGSGNCPSSFEESTQSNYYR
ncbi:S-layer homology domain-containing protein [Candidatus Gracilibacteria bacterium]|nr:S-layer homology domain-containing protein [Candidatus Gracilibacteria bacterium]